jgi:hypothetical protein
MEVRARLVVRDKCGGAVEDLRRYVVCTGRVEVMRMPVQQLSVDKEATSRCTMRACCTTRQRWRPCCLQGSDMNAKDAHGTRPLMWALQQGHVEAMRVRSGRFGANTRYRFASRCFPSPSPHQRPFHESPSRTLLVLCRTPVKETALPFEIPHVPQRNFSIAVAPLHTLTSPGRRRMAQDITDTLRRAIKWAK